MKDVNHRHSEEQREAKRAEIVAAATRLMLARGPRVEVDEIAREAGIGKGTVYLYFKSKEEVIEKVRTEVLSHIEHLMKLELDVPVKADAARCLHLLLEIPMLNRAKFAFEFVDSWLFAECWHRLAAANPEASHA